MMILIDCVTALALGAALLGDGGAFAATAYVPNEGSASISVIDTATDKVTATLKVGKKPRGIALVRRRRDASTSATRRPTRSSSGTSRARR